MTPRSLAHLESQLGRGAAAELAEVLDELDTGARGVLGDRVVGVHLVGSLALGLADEHSDVDFLVVTRTPPAPDDEPGLGELHRQLPDQGSTWAAHLEGSYAPLSDLGNPTTVGRRWLYVDNGSRELERSAHDNTAHTRWVLREHGLAVSGPTPGDGVAAISAGMLFAEAVGEARKIAALVEDGHPMAGNAWGQPFLVLTMCRVLYTAREGRVTGKAVAARWALDHVPPRFHPLVHAALADRPDPTGRSGRAADPDRVAETRAFTWEVLGLVSYPPPGRG